VQDSHEYFGCNTGNVITWIISNTHTQAQFLAPPFSTYGSIKIPNPPGASIRAMYMIQASPTVILIKPDRAIAEKDIWPISNTILRNKIIQHGGIPKDCPAGEGLVELAANPEEGGEVSGGGLYYWGDDVEANATPNEGWVFVNWTDADGEVVSEEALYVFAMPEEAEVILTANFESESYTLELIVSPEDAGEVTGAGKYAPGDLVEIEATSHNYWAFLYWHDDEGITVSTEAAYSFTMPDQDLTLTAHFENISGIEDLNEDQSILLYPNPAGNFVNLTTDSRYLGLTWSLYDQAGRILMTGKIQSATTTIELQGMPDGVYIFSVNDDVKKSIRIVKQ
jgi:hypothetical protein